MNSKIGREINATWTVAMRMIKNTFKSPAIIAFTVLMPVLMFGLFGGQMIDNLGQGLSFNFANFMLIGMLVCAFFMAATNGITSLVEDRERNMTQEIFVAPVSRYSIILGTILGASFAAYLQFFVTLIVGLCIGAEITLGQFGLLLAASPLMCLAAGSIGILIIGFIKKPNVAGMIAPMTATLQMMLCGAMIPITNSNGVLSAISHVLPMTYCIDFVRGLFYAGAPEFDAIVTYPTWVNLIVIITFTVVFFVLGTWNFVRTEKNR